MSGDTALSHPLCARATSKSGLAAAVRAGATVDTAHQLQAYTRYFASGTYDARYPGPNRLTLQRVVRLLPPPSDAPVDLIDYGCGSGRYLVPLLQVRSDIRVLAVDPCVEALGRLTARLRHSGLTGRVTLVHGAIDELTSEVAATGRRPQLALLLFGVLGHIQPHTARDRVLAGLQRILAPAEGHLAVSVPNALRRFRARPNAGRIADIVYRRRLLTGEDIDLGYHLFEAAELRDALVAADFGRIDLAAESIAAEDVVTASSLAGRLDALLAPLAPPTWGYGVFATATAL